jgi:Cd2+/Zn2+-exporting ATPase
VLDPQGRETETAVEKLRAGHRIAIKPGAQFPVDGKILKGATAADESNLTGEAAPVEKKVGDSVLSGTMNLWGAIEVLVSRPVAESSLQKIIKLIKEAQKQKAPAQQFADKAPIIPTQFWAFPWPCFLSGGWCSDLRHFTRPTNRKMRSIAP